MTATAGTPPTTIARGSDPDRAPWPGRILLLLAVALLAWLSTRGLDAQWDTNTVRGGLESRFSHVTVGQHVTHGLGKTLGLPAFVTIDQGQVIRGVNCHHPPYYWLYLSAFGALFGNSQLVLRLAHLTLFLPGLLALFALVRRRAGDVAAGFAALLFATAPLVAYYGPMVLQDGAVLGTGLVTLWAFQRFVDAPGLGRWCTTAAAFFLAASWDYSGYWWGPAMFVLAIDQERRWRAMAWVMSFLPVSAAAFAVQALHYGLHYGGPFGFLHELFTMLRLEHEAVQGSVQLADFSRAMHYLWLDHQNVWLLGLTLLGALAAATARRCLDGRGARLLWLGAATLLPGLLNCGLFFRHAVDHVFWSMHGFAGLAVLAAAVPALAIVTGRRCGVVVGAALLALPVAAAVLGVLGTRELQQRFTFVDTTDSITIIEKALPHLTGCSTAITSATVTPQFQFGGTTVEYGCDDAGKLAALLAICRANKLPGEFGFILHPRHHDSPLRQELDRIAAAVEVDGVRVYRFRM
ncbi:MAG: glycosyltransferase family 39 protein [Planctomycetes bacterium]|nr:glycosyltransferase family 39 protein [Planctomycetota bacterium]